MSYKTVNHKHHEGGCCPKIWQHVTNIKRKLLAELWKNNILFICNPMFLFPLNLTASVLTPDWSNPGHPGHPGWGRGLKTAKGELISSPHILFIEAPGDPGSASLGRKMGPCRPSKPLGRVLNSALLLFKRNASFPKSLFGLVSERPRCSGSLLFSSVTVKTTQIEHKQIPDSWLLAHSHQGPEPGLLLHLRVGPCSCVPDSIQGRKLLEEDVSLLICLLSSGHPLWHVRGDWIYMKTKV